METIYGYILILIYTINIQHVLVAKDFNVIALREMMTCTVTLLIIIGVLLIETNGIPYLFACGSNWKIYNPLSQECVDGHVVNRTISSLSSASVGPEEETNAHDYSNTETGHRIRNYEKRRTCRGSLDVLECNGRLNCGRSQGYKCCGFDVYHPGNQTCCQRSSSEYAIHSGKPDRTHICCGLDVFERGSSQTKCQHSANNDKFLKKPKRLQYNKEICEKAKNVYRLEIIQQVTGQYLTTKIGAWKWQPKEKRQGKVYISKEPQEEHIMKITLDRNSSMRKNMIGKVFLVFSNYNYLADAVLFLNEKDAVYRSPKSSRRMVRRLKKIYRKCKSKNCCGLNVKRIVQ